MWKRQYTDFVFCQTDKRILYKKIVHENVNENVNYDAAGCDKMTAPRPVMFHSFRVDILRKSILRTDSEQILGSLECLGMVGVRIMGGLNA